MKILRIMHLIGSGILLSPFIVLFIIIGFLEILICNIILKFKYNDFKGSCLLTSFKDVIIVIKEGINMNIDYVQNGL